LGCMLFLRIPRYLVLSRNGLSEANGVAARASVHQWASCQGALRRVEHLPVPFPEAAADASHNTSPAAPLQPNGGAAPQERRRCQATLLRPSALKHRCDLRVVEDRSSETLAANQFSADRSASHRYGLNLGHDSLMRIPVRTGTRAPNQSFGLACADQRHPRAALDTNDLWIPCVVLSIQ